MALQPFSCVVHLPTFEMYFPFDRLLINLKVFLHLFLRTVNVVLEGDNLLFQCWNFTRVLGLGEEKRAEFDILACACTLLVEKETCGIEAANAYGVLLVMEWTATT